MEDSAFEAIYTGAYLFIFVAALTTALFLFRNVNELAENAYEYGQDITSKSLIDTESEVETPYYDASDVISTYFNYIKKDKYDETHEEINMGYKIEIDGIAASETYTSLLEKISTDKCSLKFISKEGTTLKYQLVNI